MTKWILGIIGSGHWVGYYHEKDKNNESKLVRIINDSRIRQFTEKIQNTDWSLLNSYTECQTYLSKF